MAAEDRSAVMVATEEDDRGRQEMLGEKLGEAAGKASGVRTLRSDGAPNKAGSTFQLEVFFQGKGTLMGVEIDDIGTYWQVMRPGGVLYGEGDNVMTSAEGAAAHWTGFGVGKPSGPAPAARYGVAGHFLSATGTLAHLATVANVVEFEVDEAWNYTWRLWEWK
jgi:hypothetical protein